MFALLPELNHIDYRHQETDLTEDDQKFCDCWTCKYLNDVGGDYRGFDKVNDFDLSMRGWEYPWKIHKKVSDQPHAFSRYLSYRSPILRIHPFWHRSHNYAIILCITTT